MLYPGTQMLTPEPQEQAVFKNCLGPGITTCPFSCHQSHCYTKDSILEPGFRWLWSCLTWPWGVELKERQPDLVKSGRKGSLIKFCLKESVFGFVPALICKGMRQVMAPQGLSGLCSQCQPSFSITFSLPAINFGPGSWGLVHLSLLIDTKWSVSLLMNGRSGIVTIYFTF